MICFKVKTTAPKQYCVRPNCGFVKPGQKVIITVMLQPFNYVSSEKLKHKFLIQSIVVGADPVDNPEVLWKDVDPAEVSEHKLKCVFDIGEKPNDEQLNLEKRALIAENRKLKEGTFPSRITIHSKQPLSHLSYLAAILIAIVSIIVGIALGKFVV